jgi:pyridoxine/pyridoxamine 5'-phosphate oxidase
MPGYGLLGPTEGRGLLPWSWAEGRLAASRNYWLSTVSAVGRPHAMAVWGVWHSDSFFFSTGGASRKARNLQGNPRCTVTTEGAAEAVIVEGTALHVRDAAILEKVAARYEAKYTMGYPPDSHVYRVQPELVFAFIENASEFSGAATRWHVIR